MNTPTPHNSAKFDEIAKTVIMPGDPLRSKYIAENFLENAKLVNNVRGIQGYTGTYKGKKVKVMAHGMGNASCGIYTYELFNNYDVEKIIRVGSIGTTKEEVKIKDIVIAERAYTNTNYDNFYIENGENYISATKELVEKAEEVAKRLGLEYHTGDILCSDTYYTREDEVKKAKDHNLLGVEMESASIYLNARNANKKGLTICTVSNSLITGEETTSEERQLGFNNMIKLALEMI